MSGSDGAAAGLVPSQQGSAHRQPSRRPGPGRGAIRDRSRWPPTVGRRSSQAGGDGPVRTGDAWPARRRGGDSRRGMCVRAQATGSGTAAPTPARAPIRQAPRHRPANGATHQPFRRLGVLRRHGHPGIGRRCPRTGGHQTRLGLSGRPPIAPRTRRLRADHRLHRHPLTRAVGSVASPGGVGGRLADDEAAPDPQEGCPTLGRDRRRTEAPRHDRVERPAQVVLASCLLGTGAHDRDPPAEAEGLDRLLEEHAPARDRIHQHDLAVGPPGGREHEARHAATAPEVEHAPRRGIHPGGEAEGVLDRDAKRAGPEVSQAPALLQHRDQRRIMRGEVSGPLRPWCAHPALTPGG